MSNEKLLEKSPMGGAAIPIAIVLIGALIIFGVTRMLSTERNHRDLIQEMHSKTFGNRWVAAYELSKLFASNSIPEKDVPWVIENLSHIYENSEDARSRNFIVIALGSLKRAEAMPVLNKALKDSDDKVSFNAVVAIGNMPMGTAVDWQGLENFLASSDPGLQQAAIFALSQHQIKGSDKKIAGLLSSPEKTVRYAAAIALINYQNPDAVEVLKEIFALDYEPKKDEQNKIIGLNSAQIETIKLNALIALQKKPWTLLDQLIKDVAINDKNVKISTKAKEVLNLLKN